MHCQGHCRVGGEGVGSCGMGMRGTGRMGDLKDGLAGGCEGPQNGEAVAGGHWQNWGALGGLSQE